MNDIKEYKYLDEEFYKSVKEVIDNNLSFRQLKREIETFSYQR